MNAYRDTPEGMSRFGALSAVPVLVGFWLIVGALIWAIQ